MSKPLNDALEVCIAAMHAGVEMERCLALYPDLADELRPALEGTQSILRSSVPEPSREVQLRSRTKFLGAAAGLRNQGTSSPFQGLTRFALAGLMLCLVLVIGTGGILTASAQALPGDPLYQAKLISEDLSLSMTLSEETRRKLEDRYLTRRTEEIQVLVDLGRSEEIIFRGELQAVEDGRWIVEDISVLLPPEIDPPQDMQLGMIVEIYGTLQSEGWVIANRILPRVYKLDGEVGRIDLPFWTISGRDVYVTDLSLIERGIGLGDSVLVLVQVEDDGRLTALAIIKGLTTEDKDDSDASARFGEDVDPDEDESDLDIDDDSELEEMESDDPEDEEGHEEEDQSDEEGEPDEEEGEEEEEDEEDEEDEEESDDDK